MNKQFASPENITSSVSNTISCMPLGKVERSIKRVMDVCVALVGLAITAPIMIMTAIAIKSTSDGPVFFRQTRNGRDGVPFEIFKFRSMTCQENGNVVVQAKKNDARITPVGSVIRKTSIDELPQLFNILRGEMSIVGPRPHAAAHDREYGEKIPFYNQRFRAKPGLTGWAAVNGCRGETQKDEQMERRVRYDIDYINKWSLVLDLKIIIMTAFKIFFDKNAR